MSPLGIYIHAPFCVSKCAYCNFYSMPVDQAVINAYSKVLIKQLKRWGDQIGRPADTLYFGGGTPTLLGAENIVSVINAAQNAFSLQGAEITLEANPADDLSGLFYQVAKAGVNRVSLGAQSAVSKELAVLSRRHRFQQVQQAVLALRQAGICNYSLDVMLGIPFQTTETLRQTLEKIVALEPTHISAYLLSLEPGTPLYEKQGQYVLPNADETAEFYLQTCETLQKAGYARYEISNFAKKGYESRHNNKYWQGEDYLGLGPSAHSFLMGRRFYYPAGLEDYLKKPTFIDGGAGGGLEEYVMLALRLSRGLSLSVLAEKYKVALSGAFSDCVARLKNAGYLSLQEENICLTDRGALVSNSIIAQLLSVLECLT